MILLSACDCVVHIFPSSQACKWQVGVSPCSEIAAKSGLSTKYTIVHEFAWFWQSTQTTLNCLCRSPFPRIRKLCLEHQHMKYTPDTRCLSLPLLPQHLHPPLRSRKLPYIADTTAVPTTAPQQGPVLRLQLHPPLCSRKLALLHRPRSSLRTLRLSPPPCPRSRPQLHPQQQLVLMLDSRDLLFQTSSICQVFVMSVGGAHTYLASNGPRSF